jgi:uncharacterized membrane protein
MAIEQIGPASFRWAKQGPLGSIRVTWTIRVTEERTNDLIRYETVTPPGLTTRWEIHFAPVPESGAPVPESGDTVVREVMKPFGKLGRAALALIGKFPAEEVSANLRRLKQVIERGQVTDTSHSVPGKFSNIRLDEPHR